MPKMDIEKCARPKWAGNLAGTCMAELAFAIGQLASLLVDYCNYDNCVESVMFAVVLRAPSKLTGSG